MSHQWTIDDFPWDTRYICYSVLSDTADENSRRFPEDGEHFEQILEQIVAADCGWADKAVPGFKMAPVPL